MFEHRTVSQCISSDYCKGWNDAVDAAPKWISVTEDIPAEMEDVFVLIGGKDIATGWLDAYNGGWRVDGNIAGKVTHWMMPPVLSKEG